jgi:hypothetical protein
MNGKPTKKKKLPTADDIATIRQSIVTEMNNRLTGFGYAMIYTLISDGMDKERAASLVAQAMQHYRDSQARQAAQ